jgi:hypothetical protein
MFGTYFKKQFTPDRDIVITVDQMTSRKAIQVQRIADMKSIMVDAGTFSQGKENSMRIAAGEEVSVDFPVAVNEVKMSGRLNVRNCSDDNINFEDYAPLPGVEQISAVNVYARHHHAMFVGADE